MAANPIVHWEMMGPDGDAQKDFYSSIFDWSFQATEGFEGYYMTDAESAGVGGAVGKGPEEMPSYLTLYVQVDSIDDTLAQVSAQGGATVMPRTEIPGVVTFAMFADPAGNVVGLVEAETPAGE
jgi:predicted enzyme related to lactoylglutathione lyase